MLELPAGGISLPFEAALAFEPLPGPAFRFARVKPVFRAYNVPCALPLWLQLS